MRSCATPSRRNRCAGRGSSSARIVRLSAASFSVSSCATCTALWANWYDTFPVDNRETVTAESRARLHRTETIAMRCPPQPPCGLTSAASVREQIMHATDVSGDARRDDELRPDAWIVRREADQHAYELRQRTLALPLVAPDRITIRGQSAEIGKFHGR